MSEVALSHLLGAMNAFIGQSDDGELWNEALEKVCAGIGQVCGLSRVALFEVHQDGNPGLGVVCRADWARPGLAPIGRTPHRTIAPDSADDTQRDWARRRIRGEVIEGLTRDLTGYMRAYFEAHQIVRFYTVPVMAAGHWWGHSASPTMMKTCLGTRPSHPCAIWWPAWWRAPPNACGPSGN